MDELEWLNRYNAEVREKVAPLLRETGDEEAMECVRSLSLSRMILHTRRRSGSRGRGDQHSALSALTRFVRRRWLERSTQPISLV